MKPEDNDISFADLIEWVSIMFRAGENGNAQQLVSRRWIERLNDGRATSSFLQNYIDIGCLAPIIAGAAFVLTGPFADYAEHDPNVAFAMFIPGGAAGQDIREKSRALEAAHHAIH
jgi:hypothetical protein